MIRPLEGVPQLTEDTILRIAVDGLDRISEAGAPSLRRDLARLGALPAVRLVTTSRKEASAPKDAFRVELGLAARSDLADFLIAQGLTPADADAATEWADGEWLRAYLLSLTDARPSEHKRGELGSLFDGAIARILERESLDWDDLRPLLGPLAAAGSGPVLPERSWSWRAPNSAAPGTRQPCTIYSSPWVT